ncbi:MAG: hypothetical protein CSYNP_02458 [Syntrophus sp. SKADARSKE-3]|nr:hypothetical protein [Syntrophus sp. SKADARSKE-3]
MGIRIKPRYVGPIFIVLICFLCALSLVQVASAAPKQNLKAKGGDCAACHGNEKVLPEGHPYTKAMNAKSCLACHKEEKTSLAGKMPGGHVHRLSDITCASCHGKVKKPEAVAMDKCIACHGSTDKLAEKTSKVKPENPHTSPHYGTTLDCTLCHKQHAKSENYCNQCHKFDFKVP